MNLGKFARAYVKIARRDEAEQAARRKQQAVEERRRNREIANAPAITPDELASIREQLERLAVDYDAKSGRLQVRRKPKSEQPRCGAKCRDGHPCRTRLQTGEKRCRRHGGASTGPKTPEGRAAIAESNRRRTRGQSGTECLKK